MEGGTEFTFELSLVEEGEKVLGVGAWSLEWGEWERADLRVHLRLHLSIDLEKRFRSGGGGFFLLGRLGINNFWLVSGHHLALFFTWRKWIIF